MNNSKPRCCIITPVGPGHARLYEACKASVQQAFKRSQGAFSEIILHPVDDSHGQYGRSNRRNAGIHFAHSQGIEYIFFLDADDLMLEAAFETVAPYIGDYDAIWGAIYDCLPGEQPSIRPDQLMPVHTLRQVLAKDPYFTLQMGHFIRTGAALGQLFDTELDTGEDFKYYLDVWRDNNCIKLDKPFFLNRRGMPSTGPKSADGIMWRDAVAGVFLDFRIANAGTMPTVLDEQSTYPNGRHVVVTGFPHSGTATLCNMLGSSLAGFTAPEKEIPAASVIGSETGNLLTASPLDVFNAQEIDTANTYHKAVDFIVIIRDIRAVITSRHASVPDDYFIGHDHQYCVYPDGTYRYCNPGVLAIFNAIAQLTQSNLPGKTVVVRYEAIARSAIAVQELLAKQLELGYRDRFDRFNNHEIPPAPDLAWKKPEHRARIKQQFTDCPQLFEVLKATGYEKDATWFNQYAD